MYRGLGTIVTLSGADPRMAVIALTWNSPATLITNTGSSVNSENSGVEYDRQ